MNALDTTRPHPARRYNYWLGGKDNFQADRDSADAIQRAFPNVRTAAQENRRCLERVVDLLAERGVDQFIDVGCGLPVEPAVHEIAGRHHPAARVVYIDNDPLVVVHGRALMDGSAPAVTAHMEADLTEPEDFPSGLGILDLHRPVALLLFAVVHFLDDLDAPGIRALIDRLPAGSYVAMTHATEDFATAAERAATADLRASGAHGGFWPRSLDEIAELLAGLLPAEPGIVPIVDWHPDREPKPRTRQARAVAGYAVVAQKL